MDPTRARTVPRPDYDRRRVQPGIVHVGVGGFHRAHEAMYVDRLLRAGEAFGWGIRGVGVMPADRRMKEALLAQDCLYTLVLKHSDGRREPRIIGAVVDYLYAPDDPPAVTEAMASPATGIVSLTITEGGYNVDDVTGVFDATPADVAHDLARHGPPRTAFGLVVEALRLRRDRGLGAFTVMSCDNLEDNGHVARSAFTAFARLQDPGLGDWIEETVRFPNSMVDRITPVTTDADRRELADTFGVADRVPVVCEPYAEWVLEDAFSAGRPPFEHAGVRIVADVWPYELMKLRLLNASHQVMAYFGRLCGYEYVHEAAQDPAMQAFLVGYMEEEARPTLAPVPLVDLDEYRRTLLARFANPEVRDTLARVGAETSDRIPKFLLPLVRDQLATGGEIRRSAAAVASWARYAEGVDDQGHPIEVVDRLAERVTQLARRQREVPDAFIADRAIFGDLATDARFAAAYRSALASLHEHGAHATLRALA